MLGRSLMNAGRRAARTVGRRNMSSADPYAAPEVLKGEFHFQQFAPTHTSSFPR